ncbi:hypothetical protein DAR30_24775 [Salmonella enterica subsp. enterica serovar Enteritidis]|nr:hypothetical protein [Salmonella enterica subsp. enterica serovar Typhi]EBW2381236.1 hypothetical protein [Salmonella enterica subsp. enterica serovar Enteritidis]
MVGVTGIEPVTPTMSTYNDIPESAPLRGIPLFHGGERWQNMPRTIADLPASCLQAIYLCPLRTAPIQRRSS